LARSTQYPVLVPPLTRCNFGSKMFVFLGEVEELTVDAKDCTCNMML
jgi:hypothetical protein